MHATTIVGYTFDADNYCPDCTLVAVKAKCPLDYPIASTIEPWNTVETLLDFVARQKRIDRQDEHSFDSGDFPKVVFSSQVHDGCNTENGYAPGQCGDQCGGCHESLGFECPNVATTDADILREIGMDEAADDLDEHLGGQF